MLKKKIALIIGARPNFMKAFPVYEALQNDFELTLIHTGQHFDEKMSKVFFEQLKFPHPDIHLTLEKRTKAGDFDDKLYLNNIEYLKNKDKVIEDIKKYNEDLGQLGEIRDKLLIEFNKIKPDLVIVFGDVTSTLASSIAAKILNIELAHVESGLRSGDIKMPEEVNRILTDHITDYYFVTEESGVNNLKDIGITENVYLVGNTMIDTQKKYLQEALNTKYHEKLGVKTKEYILITLHRPSNVDNMEKLKEIFDNLEDLSKTNKLVYPIHPRTKKNLKKMDYIEKVENNSNIILLEPLGYLEFMCLMANCKYVVTDSGGLQEETTALDIPCFTLRENTERPSTFIENHGTNQLINKISDIELKECKSSMDLWDGKSSEKIYLILYCIHYVDSVPVSRYDMCTLLKLYNIYKKKKIYEFRDKMNHPIHTASGNKIDTYNYCIKNNIDVAKMLYYGKFKELKINNIEKQSFVIKPINECSSRGVYIIKYNNVQNYYTELFTKKKYIEINDFLNSIKEYYEENSCFIEEYIEHTINGKNVPAIDYKVFCYNGIPKQVRIISRENEKLGGKIIVSLYSLKTFKEINLNEYYLSPYHLRHFTNNNIAELKETKEELIKLANFSKSLLNKMEFNEGIISLDLYKVKEKYLLGEFTIDPGALYYPTIGVKYLREIFY